MPHPTLLDWLHDGPFTLALSAGFFGFYAHAGMLSALEEAGVAPTAVAGASAGALIAGGWASGRSAVELAERLLRIERRDYWDPALGAGLLRGRLFRSLLQETLACDTFEACRAPVALSAWDVDGGRTVVLRSGDLAEAVHASCCFPGLLQPVRIAGRRHLDGGIGDRAGMHGVPAGGRVLHHHLSTRSPWRRKGSAALDPPAGPGLVALVLDGLPRLSPFHMERGGEAYSLARDATRRALELPVDAVVRLSVSAQPA